MKVVEHSKDYFKIEDLLITEVWWISENGLKIKSFCYDDFAWWKGEIVSANIIVSEIARWGNNIQVKDVKVKDVKVKFNSQSQSLICKSQSCIS